MKSLPVAQTSEKRDFAYETKFLIPEELAEAALALARRHLSPDPFAGGATGDGYCVNSVYLDTPGFDVYHRRGSYGRCKYRVRRYGQEPAVFLERKMKTRGLVGKRRSRVPDAEVARLETGRPSPEWPGFWFHRRLLARGLEPKCQIAYDRVARVGLTQEGPIRMTLDRHVRSFPTSVWHVQEAGPWEPLLERQCILEMKYRKNFPPLFEQIIRELAVKPAAVSKYRLGVQKFGWAGDAPPNIIPVNGQSHPALHAASLPATAPSWADPLRRA